MLPYKSFTFDYNQNEFLKLYNDSKKVQLKKRVNAELKETQLGQHPFVEFFEHFNFIPESLYSVELSRMTENQLPHVNLGNNGLLIFPVSGKAKLKIYDYQPQSFDEQGRPYIDTDHMTEQQIQDLELSLKEVVDITSPMAINGAATQSLIIGEEPCIVLVLKIPLSVLFENVIKFLDTESNIV